ncbi:MAG: GTPase HflX [Betaproteobacteria bacterium]|nr:GTPase HflX [Betaproteobacteria bacterium]
MSHKLVPDAKSINFRTDDMSQLSEVERSLALEQARLQLEQRAQGGMNAYLVSLELVEDDPQEVQESLVELGSLVRSLGDEPVGVTVQKRSRIVPATLIGTGKAEELRTSAQELKIDYVVFDQELSPSQVRNLETIIERPVLDRAGVILQIFRKNAKTREAKTQVEIAHLEYLAPRISNSWIAFERQRGGGSGGTRLKGAGETQLELDKRRIREKIISLRKELERIQTERSTQRKLRSEEFNVVLVGYTNAGKTTLMNALTDSQLSAKDALFETLDSAVRTLKGAHNPKVLVTDTVGFIRSIPHGLVASFRSTLQEAARADLLVHVVDVSHPRYKDHIRITDDVLKEVGAGDVDRMYVFNKIDSLKGEPRLGKILARAYKNAVCLSAQQPDDIRKLREALFQHFSKNMLELSLQVAYDNAVLMAAIYAHSRILSTEWTDENAHFKIRVSRAAARRYFAQLLSQEERASLGLTLDEEEEHLTPNTENQRP